MASSPKSSSRIRPSASAGQGSLFESAATAPETASTSHTAVPPSTPQSLALPLAQQFTSLSPAWQSGISSFVSSPAYAKLCDFVDGERAQGKTVYPDEVFRALKLTQPQQVKVVILGQDPYHGDDHGRPQAHGLAFSVRPGVRPPPSLKNIYKEIHASLGHPIASHGCLDHWAQQGVLLLNTVLSVEAGRPASHAKHGWEQCTDALIAHLASQNQGVVFMLWGAHAQAKRTLLPPSRHTILEAPHPSPLSAHRGFLGCAHFALANAALTEAGKTPIDWQLPPTV